GILVQKLHVRVGRGAIEVEVVFLDVLAVVSLAVREPEQPFLQDGVFPVPQTKSETELLFVIRDPTETVLAPAIRPGTRLIMRKEVPGVPVFAVILTDGPPLPLREVRAPLPPRSCAGASFCQSVLLCVRHCRSPRSHHARESSA